MTPQDDDLERRKTPKELAKERRDRRLRMRVMSAVGALALLVIGILAYGWYDVNVLSEKRPVLTVNGESVTQREFQARVRLIQIQILNQMQQIQSMAAFLPANEQSQEMIRQQVQQLQMQLENPNLLGQQVIDQMTNEVLIRQEAEARGITVSEQEVDRMIQEVFGYYADGTPTPAPTRTPRPTVTLDPTLAAQATPSSTPTEPPTQTPGPSPTASPSATPYTLEGFQANYQSYLTALEEEGIEEEDYRAFARAEVYRQKLLEEFGAQVDREQEQVRARHILVEDEATAQEVLDELEAGEPFVELAAEYSTDQSNKDRGGDLGWFGRGQMVGPFEQAAFEAEVGEVVGPVQTQFGFHIIEVLDHEVRQLEQAAYEQAVEQAFLAWLNQATQEAEIEVNENWVEIVPTVEPQEPVPF